MVHAEGLRESEYLCADIAHADKPECASDEAHTQVILFVSPSIAAREPVFDEQLMAEREDKRDDGCGDRAAHAIGSNCHQYAVFGACIESDFIVAYAESRDDC